MKNVSRHNGWIKQNVIAGATPFIEPIAQKIANRISIVVFKPQLVHIEIGPPALCEHSIQIDDSEDHIVTPALAVAKQIGISDFVKSERLIPLKRRMLLARLIQDLEQRHQRVFPFPRP